MSNMDLKQKIEKILEENVRPMVARHAGGIELIDVDESTGIVKVRFQGTCVGCPMSTITLKAGVESELMDALPEVREVLAVDEHGVVQDSEMMLEEDEEDLKAWSADEPPPRPAATT